LKKLAKSKEKALNMSRELKEKIGTLLYILGFKYGASTDISDSLSLGYGKLDDNGFWEYPIKRSLIKKLVITPFWKFKSVYKSLFVISIESITPYKKDCVERNGKKEFIAHVAYAKFIIQFPKILKKEFKYLRKDGWKV
jgi:hypothetical protein